MRRARFIVNPRARTIPSRDRLATAPAWLKLHGWRVDTIFTESPESAVAAARDAAAEGYDTVVAVGGDGTIHGVVNALAGSATALAVVPGGTANVWAREIGAPTHPGSVAAMVHRGERRPVDLGVATSAEGGEPGRYFLLMASLGLDSITAAAVATAAKSRFGRFAYIERGFREAFRYRGVEAEIIADGERRRLSLLLLLLGNSRSYGGVIRISHRATVDDGLLDLVCYPAGGPAGVAGHLARTAFGRHAAAAGTLYKQVREVEVRTEPAVHVQADGEIIGRTPMRFAVAPGALQVVVPEGARLPLWGAPSRPDGGPP